MAAIDQKLLLEKVASFQARAGAARSRIDDLSASLDDAGHLLAASDASTGRSAGVSSAVRGAHKLLLDWSLCVIAHLAGALKTKDDAKYAERTATAQAALLDPRLWKVLVKSMDGTARAEGSFSVPQSVGVPLLQAGLYVVHVPATSTAAAQAAGWAVKALQAACGLQQQTTSNKPAAVPTAAPLHMTLDSFMQLLESAVAQRSAAGATTVRPASGAFLTLMLRHAAALQAQQTNQKKVFATACAKVMDMAFEVSATGDAALAKAAETLLCDGLFHEEHLEGFQSAFVKPSAAATTAVAGDLNEAAATEETPQHDRKRAKRQRKLRERSYSNELLILPVCMIKINIDAAASAAQCVRLNCLQPCRSQSQQQKAAGDGAAVTATGDTVTRRTCYQQELFEKLSSIVHTTATTAAPAAATAATTAAATVQLRALQRLPLLLQGFTSRLQAARHRRSAEAAAAALAAGNSASSSSSAKHVSGSSRAATAHPGALPFKFWAALSRTLVRLFDTADQVRGCELYCVAHYSVTSKTAVCVVVCKAHAT
eukprot:15564-Heterococcus_DN1.PRE.5